MKTKKGVRCLKLAIFMNQNTQMDMAAQGGFFCQGVSSKHKVCFMHEAHDLAISKTWIMRICTSRAKTLILCWNRVK